MLYRYAYSDSFAPVCADNVMDVLAASKKYMMNKLTRYCYEFIQNKITAETAIAFWRKAKRTSGLFAQINLAHAVLTKIYETLILVSRNFGRYR